MDSYFSANIINSSIKAAEHLVREELFYKIIESIDLLEPVDINLICNGDASLGYILEQIKGNFRTLEENQFTNDSIETKEQLSFNLLTELIKDIPKTAGKKEQVEFLLEKCESHYAEGRYYGSYRYLNDAFQLVDKIEDKAQREYLNFRLYNIRGHWLYTMELMELALENYEAALNALKLLENTDCFNEEDIAVTYVNIGDVLNIVGNTSKALDYYNQSALIFENSMLSDTHNEDYSLLLAKRGQLHKELGNINLADADLSMSEKYKHPQEKLNELFIDAAKRIGRSLVGLINTEEFSLEIRLKLKELYAQTKPRGMNILAMQGDRVIYKGTGKMGLAEDQNRAETHLKTGDVYVVKTTYVSDCFSHVLLEEYPDVLFNTMYFYDYIN